MVNKKSNLVYSTRTDADLGRKKSRGVVSVPPQQQTIGVRLDKKKRRGKTVTVAAGFILSPADLKSMEKELKQYCGAGGTGKGDEIEIQGDHREKVMQKLADLKYKVKRVGG